MLTTTSSFSLSPTLLRFSLLIAGSVTAQILPRADFADSIKTSAAIQRTLERCDGNPGFETALVNWLEMAEPSSPAERQAVRETSLRLLEDTTDLQLALGLSDGLLRHALEDIRRSQAVVPEVLARALYQDIGRALGTHRSKRNAVAASANGLVEDGTVIDERQASFLEAFLKLAEPRVTHFVRPARRQIEEPPGQKRSETTLASTR